MLPLIVAWASQLSSDRRAAMRGVVLAAAVAAVCFVLQPVRALSLDEFWSDVRRQEEAASGFGKLGLDYDSGCSITCGY